MPPYRPWLAAIPLLAALLAGLRWLTQGTGSIYSKLDQHLYVPDVDLGWRRTAEGFVWLGLDLVLGLAVFAVGLLAAGRWLRGRWRGLDLLHSASAWLGILSLIVPIYAFASGSPAQGAKEVRPGLGIEAPEGGIQASLSDLPAGRYAILAHPDNAVSAQLIAGGETFDARFAGGFQGYWVADPTDLTQPMRAEASVSSASIETGIDLRNKHALEDLKPREFPRITFQLNRLRGTSAGEGPRTVTFSAAGEVALAGKAHEVDVTGTIAAVGKARADRLGIDPSFAAKTILVQAGFSLDLRETVVGNEGTFDTNEIPVTVTLVLTHQAKAKP